MLLERPTEKWGSLRSHRSEATKLSGAQMPEQRRAGQLVYIYIYRPADLCLWSGARRQGRMLRAKSSRRNFVWERSSVLVHACSFTFVFEFVTDRTCQSLAFAFDCQHWTTEQKILVLLKNAIKSKKPGLSFASGPAGIETCFCFPICLPIEKAYSTKQRYYCNSLSCKLLPQLIDYSATKGFFFFFDRQLSYSCLSHSGSVLAANGCRVSSTLSFFLIGKRKPGPTRKRVLACPPTCVPHKHQQPELVRQSNLCVGWCIHAKKPYHNVARQSPLIFSISLHQISCRRVQSIFDSCLRQPQQSPRLAHNALHFPS